MLRCRGYVTGYIDLSEGFEGWIIFFLFRVVVLASGLGFSILKCLIKKLMRNLLYGWGTF